MFDHLEQQRFSSQLNARHVEDILADANSALQARAGANGNARSPSVIRPLTA